MRSRIPGCPRAFRRGSSSRQEASTACTFQTLRKGGITIPRHSDRPRKGFTLLELLIVLGIILILSAIATENYLAASVRARISRVRTEFRTIATAIESYTTDYGAVPRMAHYRFYGDPNLDFINGVGVAGVLSPCLTTPITYLTALPRSDPFMSGNQKASLDERLYTYQDLRAYRLHEPNSMFWPEAIKFYGLWRLGSVGPDETFYHGFRNSGQLPYDPTNGLISFGNIWYSPGTGFDRMPPIPALLGKH